MPTTDSLDIRDYLAASADASKRTRTITIILVIASVLVLAGLLNSLQSHWMLRRIVKLGEDIRGPYTESKLGPYPDEKKFPSGDNYRKAVELYEQRYKDLCSAVARAYVDNSMVVRVPFLGFTFDVNDLGLLGGFGFLIMLVCYRFFLTREVDNLRLSFDEARRLGKGELEEFYKLLAMRQVFTVPLTRYVNRTRFLQDMPKLICWFPLLAYILVTANDISTAWIGHELQYSRYQVLIGFEIVVALLLLVLSIGITRRLVRMDTEWDQCWDEIQGKASVTAASASRVAEARES
jgi:hypothetical protein